jgi:hypothetical protein
VTNALITVYLQSQFYDTGAWVCPRCHYCVRTRTGKLGVSLNKISTDRILDRCDRSF